MSKRLKVPKKIAQALEAVGNYRLHRGKRHIHIYVNGQFTAIAPHCVSGDGERFGHSLGNVLAQIKRVGGA